MLRGRRRPMNVPNGRAVSVDDAMRVAHRPDTRSMDAETL
jgi:hypothetical protein